MIFVYISTHVSKILTVAGTALIKPTNFLLLETRTAQCHCFLHSGGFKALKEDKDTELMKVILHIGTNNIFC